MIMNMLLNFAETATDTTGDTTTTTSGEFSWQSVLQSAVEWITHYGLNLLVGLVVLFILFALVNVLAKSIRKTMMKRGVEKTVYTVTYGFIRKGLKFVLFIVFLGFIGVETAAIGSIIASIGVAIGLAVQGSLSNFAGGLIIYTMRPFKIGDYIEAQGHSGTVEDIHLFYTYIVTPDNKLVLLPNGALSNDSIVNYSAKPLRRLDLTFAISYNEDFERAEKVLQEICRNNEKILEDPKPLIKVSAHADSSINIVVKVWVNNSDYWEVNYAMLEEVKRRFDEEKIEIPYNQLDVHVIAPKE